MPPGEAGFSLANQSDANITGNVIVRNHATGAGGGIYWTVPLGPRGPVLVNNTIAENDSALGSGIFADGFDGSATLYNNIVTAAAGQTAIHCGDFDASVPVFWSNNVFSASGSSYGGTCTDRTGTGGNISANPRFADPATGDVHLLPGSPAIDAGDNSAPGQTATDIDDHARVLDGNADGLAAADMGADEAATGGSPDGLPGAFARTSPADGAEGQPTLLPLRWAVSAGATGYE